MATEMTWNQLATDLGCITPPHPTPHNCQYNGTYKASSFSGAPCIIQHMFFACWIHKATHTHSLRICNTCWFSMATVVTQTLLIVTLYIHYVLSWMPSTIIVAWGHSHTKIVLLQSYLGYLMYIFSLQSTGVSWCCQQKHHQIVSIHPPPPTPLYLIKEQKVQQNCTWCCNLAATSLWSASVSKHWITKAMELNSDSAAWKHRTGPRPVTDHESQMSFTIIGNSCKAF
jgi:hypothetical protein